MAVAASDLADSGLSAAGREGRDRMYPVFAGSALIRGRRMIVRLPAHDAEIRATPSLLRTVFESCDGTCSFDEIVNDRANAGRRTELVAFLDELIRVGVLVDAGNLLPSLAKIADQSSSWGTRFEPDVWERFLRPLGSDPGRGSDSRCVRPATTDFARLAQARESVRVFGDITLDSRTIGALLSAMYGVVTGNSADDPRGNNHRTVPSAGSFYSLEFHLILLRPATGLSSGVYRVRYIRTGEIGFERVSSTVQGMARAVLQPELLERAAGMIVISADVGIPALKYRNRALPYLLLEAGACLQNGALVAGELGLATTAFGGFIEEEVSKLCAIDGQSILTTLVFGSRPTVEQNAAARNAPATEFSWVDVPGLPFHLARVRLNDRDPPLFGWGKDADPAIAYAKALSEAVEWSAVDVAGETVCARMADLPAAIDPRTLVRYTEAQYRRGDFPYPRFDPSGEYRWKSGIDLVSGREVFVLADCVYSPMAFPEPYRSRLYTHTFSSGCATAASWPQAMLRATLELIERDAFMRHWFMQQGGIELAPQSLPAELQRRVKLLVDSGCRVSVQRLPSDVAYVCLTLIQHRERHFTCVDTAASFDETEAVDSALTSAEVQAWVRMQGNAAPHIPPKQVKTMQDHADLYCQKAYFSRADALFSSGGASFPATTPKQFLASMDKLVEILRNRISELIWVDLCPSGPVFRHGCVPLLTVRALAPGLVPLTFGAGCLPLGMTRQAARGSLFPHPFA